MRTVGIVRAQPVHRILLGLISLISLTVFACGTQAPETQRHATNASGARVNGFTSDDAIVVDGESMKAAMAAWQAWSNAKGALQQRDRDLGRYDFAIAKDDDHYTIDLIGRKSHISGTPDIPATGARIIVQAETFEIVDVRMSM